MRKEKREFVDWYSAKPFEIVQMDVKHIRDQKALSKEQIIHLDRYRIPNYQWGALDVNSRFKLIAYSREKSWTNGLCWYLWVISWLRSHGVKAQIVFTVDNGEEFGGKSWMKVKELRKLISGFGCRLIQNHKGHAEENAHLERSHRTDDEEFYIPRVFAISSEANLLQEAMGYLYYYNNVREHSSLNYKTPFAYLEEQTTTVHDTIRFAQPFILDDVSVKLGPWSGYNVLAQHPIVSPCSPRVAYDTIRRADQWVIYVNGGEPMKAVFFDLYNTLITYDPPREEMQKEACAQFGIEVTLRGLRRGLSQADPFWLAEDGRSPISKRSGEEQLRFYTAYEKTVLGGAGVEVPDDVALKILLKLREYKYVAVLFDDALPAIDELKKRGLTVGLISNVRRDQEDLLKGLGLMERLDLIITSHEVGADKPDPRIFMAALEQAGVQATDSIYVGDLYDIDVLGARGVGIKPLLLDRYGLWDEITDCDKIDSLSQIIQYL